MEYEFNRPVLVAALLVAAVLVFVSWRAYRTPAPAATSKAPGAVTRSGLEAGAPPTTGFSFGPRIKAAHFSEFVATLSTKERACVEAALGDEFGPLLKDPTYLIKNKERVMAMNQCLR